jgi:ribosomal protein L17
MTRQIVTVVSSSITVTTKSKAQELKDRADRLAGETTNKLDKLRSKKILEFYIE